MLALQLRTVYRRKDLFKKIIWNKVIFKSFNDTRDGGSIKKLSSFSSLENVFYV